MKTCTKCGRELPREMFGRCTTVRSGLKSRCRDCGRAYAAAYRATHREEVRARNAAWRVAHPEERRAYMADYRAAHAEETRTYMADYRAAHREENRSRCAAYYTAYAEGERARSAAYRVAHPEERRVHNHNRRARLRGAPGHHTAADVAAQYLRQHGRCFWCKAKLDEYHTDHVIPLALKGSNGKENIVVACATCNMTKHAKHPMDFAGVMF